MQAYHDVYLQAFDVELLQADYVMGLSEANTINSLVTDLNKT
jgi:hypothetical protein